MGKLDGRIAVITGAARGQGRSHALTLAQEGAEIVACDICKDIKSVPYPLGTQADLDETIRLVRECGRRGIGLKADVRSGRDMQRVAEAAISEFGKIDILIANASISSFSPISAMSDEQFDDVVDINLKGVFNSIRAVLPHMMSKHSGRIVVTSSSAGQIGFAKAGHYSATKWALIGLVKSVALEAAEYWITVNGVIPIEVNTIPFHNPASYSFWRPDLDNPGIDDVAPVVKRLNTMAITAVEPKDVSNAVLFLVSDQARYITGHFINVDAGRAAMIMGA